MLQLCQDCMVIILPGLGVQFAVLYGEQSCVNLFGIPPPPPPPDTPKCLRVLLVWWWDEKQIILYYHYHLIWPYAWFRQPPWHNIMAISWTYSHLCLSYYSLQSEIVLGYEDSDFRSRSFTHQVLQQGKCLESGKHTNISKQQHWHTSISIIRGIHPSAPPKQHPPHPPTCTHTCTYTHLRMCVWMCARTHACTHTYTHTISNVPM